MAFLARLSSLSDLVPTTIDGSSKFSDRDYHQSKLNESEVSTGETTNQSQIWMTTHLSQAQNHDLLGRWLGDSSNLLSSITDTPGRKHG